MFLGINAFHAVGRRGADGAQCYPLLRTVLESACYVLLVARNPALATSWSARHEGEAERKACRKAFGSAPSEAVKIVSAQQADLAAFIHVLYEAHIDFGAAA